MDKPTLTKQFMESNAWSVKYNLPCVTLHNNPHIYLAYAVKIISDAGEDVSEILETYSEFLKDCELEPGLIYRWPDKTGGSTSHDELMGVAYLNPLYALKIYDYLIFNKGRYDNGSDPQKPFRFFRFNLFRLPWFVVFLRSCADLKIRRFEKIIFSMFLFLDAFFFNGKGNEGGRLRIWLMLDTMSKHCPWAVQYWVDTMQNKWKLNPHECFRFYLSECPVFYKTSPNRFM